MTAVSIVNESMKLLSIINNVLRVALCPNVSQIMQQTSLSLKAGPFQTFKH